MKEVTLRDEQPEVKAKKRKPRSAIKFPYYDLQDAVEVTRKVQDEGGGECSLELLARYLEAKSTSSGAFRSRVAAAITFGLIATRAGNYAVTDRGLAIIAPVHEGDDQRAKVEAFLSVPLFREVYDLYRGSPLPPEVGLKTTFRTRFNIVEDRVDPSYRVFMRSAEQAGFFSTGKSHLVEPPTKPLSTEAPSEEGETHDEPGGGGGSGDGGGTRTPSVHPALAGLLQLLPPDKQGWTKDQFDTWILGFTAAVKMLHPVSEEG